MKARDYCCCAIPVVNFGIYATLAEQMVLAFLTAILLLATPKLVGANLPGFAGPILAVICFLIAGVQILGFIGVAREKTILYRRYTTVHILLTLIAFALAATWIGVSAGNHKKAQTQCELEFFNSTNVNITNSAISQQSEGQTLCEIFTWVDVGLLGGLWLILAVMQFYLYTVISSYGTGQRDDHEKYNALYLNGPGNYSTDIPMTTNRGDPWDARPSTDEDRQRFRHESTASVATILAEKPQQSRDYGGYQDVGPSDGWTQQAPATTTYQSAAYGAPYTGRP